MDKGLTRPNINSMDSDRAEVVTQPMFPARRRQLRDAASPLQRVDMIDVVRKADWYCALPDPAKQWTGSRLREHTLIAGQYLGRRGEIPAAWYGLVDGVVKSSVVSADGRASTLGGILPGSWFGEGGLLRSKPRHSDYVALRDSRVAILGLDDFLHLLHTQAVFKDFILMQLAERLHYFMNQMGNARLMKTPARVAHTLCGLMHPLNNPLGQPWLPISQEELATIAGVSRQRCNHALAQMQKQGWISISYGGIWLDAPARVAEMARPD